MQVVVTSQSSVMIDDFALKDRIISMIIYIKISFSRVNLLINMQEEFLKLHAIIVEITINI